MSSVSLCCCVIKSSPTLFIKHIDYTVRLSSETENTKDSNMRHKHKPWIQRLCKIQRSNKMFSLCVKSPACCKRISGRKCWMLLSHHTIIVNYTCMWSYCSSCGHTVWVSMWNSCVIIINPSHLTESESWACSHLCATWSQSWSLRSPAADLTLMKTAPPSPAADVTRSHKLKV